MIFVSIITNKVLTLQQEIQLKASIKRILNKNVIIHIEDNQILYFNDDENECIVIKCNEANENNKIKEIIKTVENITKISKQYQCIIFK